MLNLNELFNSAFSIDRDLSMKALSEIDIHDSSSLNGQGYDMQWNGMPGSYGAFYGNIDDMTTSIFSQPWPTIEPVLENDAFISNRYEPFKAAEKIISTQINNGSRYTCFAPNGKREMLQILDIEKGTYLNKTISGLAYTLANLEKGIPVVFGVNYLPYPTTDKDPSTNHYIVIVGAGNDGKNYLLGWDIACEHSEDFLMNDMAYNGGTSPNNKLYLDDNWPGLISAAKAWNNPHAQSFPPYKVTQIIKTFLK